MALNLEQAAACARDCGASRHSLCDLTRCATGSYQLDSVLLGRTAISEKVCSLTFRGHCFIWHLQVFSTDDRADQAHSKLDPIDGRYHVDRSCLQARRVSEALLKQASQPDAQQGFAEKKADFWFNTATLLPQGWRQRSASVWPMQGSSTQNDSRKVQHNTT